MIYINRITPQGHATVGKADSLDVAKRVMQEAQLKDGSSIYYVSRAKAGYNYKR